MVDSIAVRGWAVPILDSNGDPISDGTVEFYDAGTTDARTVYSTKDLSTTSLGTTVDLNAAGMLVNDANALVVVYTGNTDYKVIIKDSSGATVYTLDNIKGAIDTSALGGSSGGFSGSVVSETSDFSVDSTYDTKVVHANPTGGEFTATFDDATTLGDGFVCSFRHDGTVKEDGTFNPMRLATVSGQTIDVPGANAADGYVLRSMGHFVTVSCDGANFLVTNETLPLGEQSPITIVDFLTSPPSPPSSPTAGAMYIIESTPTGDWASYAEHDIVQADGQGGWIKYTPPTDCGWLAYDQDGNTLYQFRASAWVGLTNITAPTESNLKYAVFQQRKVSNTAGDTPTATTWTAHSFSDEDVDTIGISATLPGTSIPVPTGSYLVFGSISLGNVSSGRARIYNSTDSAVVAQGPNQTDSGEYVATVMTPLIVTEATENIQLQYYVGAANAATAVNTSEQEIYAELMIIDLESIQGPAGSQGIQGVAGSDGGISFWNWETSTSSGPSSGAIRFDNATFASVTEIYVHETDGNSVDMSALLATFDDSTSTVKGLIYLHEDKASSNFWLGRVTALTDNGSDVTLTVTHIASNGSFDAGDDIKMEYYRTGDAGSTGATGSNGQVLIDYTFDAASQADSDPGSGTIRANNATAASVTAFYMDDLDRLGADQSTAIDAFDASSSSGVKSTMYMEDLTSGERWTYDITAASDSSGYWEITVTHVAGTGSFASNNVAITVVPRGDAGSGLAALLNDTTPQLGGVLDTNDNQVRWSKGSDLASATSLTIGSDGNVFDVTGTTTITSFSDVAVGTCIILQFDGALTLTHHATDLILPTGANITTAAGDVGMFVQYASGDWYCAAWTPAAYLLQPATTSLAGLLEIATADEYRGNDSADLALTVGKVWDAMAEVALTSSSNSVAWDMDNGIDFDIDTLGENTTIANPTNVIVGKKGRLRIVQDGTGSRTVAWGSNFEFAGGTAPTATTTADAEDVFFYDCISATRILITNVLDIS